MGKIDKDKAGETALHVIEVLQKMVLGFIPGGHLVEGLMKFRGDLKQKRVSDFCESLKSVLEEYADRELNATDFENEDFVDVMEAVFIKVQTTKSQLKKERYRNILAKQILAPAPNYEVQSYLKLLDELNDIEIIMLDLVKTATPQIEKEKFPIRMAWYNRDKPIVDPGEQVRIYLRIGDEDVPVNDAQIDFLEKGLVSKGLLMFTFDRTKQLIGDYTPKELLPAISKQVEKYRETDFKETFYDLTQFAESFLEYIKLPEKPAPCNQRSTLDSQTKLRR